MGPTISELTERTRHFIEEEGPWNNGGKQACCGAFGISMTHDEFAKALGPTYQQILDAGFVLVPKQWRDNTLTALGQKDQPG